MRRRACTRQARYRARGATATKANSTWAGTNLIGAIRGADGRQQILRLGLRGHWRQRFAALLARIAALPVATVAQFAADQKNPVPRPWKPPPPRFQPPLLPALK